MSRAAIIAIEDSSEAHLLRLHLEHLGMQVALNRPGKPSDFFAAFSFFGNPCDLTIICGHGDTGGFIFPEMAEGVDELVLPDDRITPGLVSAHLKNAPPMVISTACATGTDAFAAAFAEAGSRQYVAPVGDPLGPDVPLWVAACIHALTMRHMQLEKAIATANDMVDAESAFRLFDYAQG